MSENQGDNDNDQVVEDDLISLNLSYSVTCILDQFMQFALSKPEVADHLPDVRILGLAGSVRDYVSAQLTTTQLEQQLADENQANGMPNDDDDEDDDDEDDVEEANDEVPALVETEVVAADQEQSVYASMPAISIVNISAPFTESNNSEEQQQPQNAPHNQESE